MKNRNKAIFILPFILISFNGLAMDGFFGDAASGLGKIGWEGLKAAGKAAEEVAKGVNRVVDDIAEQRRRAAEQALRRKQQLQADMNSPYFSEAQRLRFKEQLDLLEKNEREAEEQMKKMQDGAIDFAKNFANQASTTAINQVAESLNERRNMNLAALQAREARRGTVQATKEWIKALNNRNTAMGLVAVCGGVFTCWQASKVGADWVRTFLGKPVLAQETSLKSVKEQFLDWLLAKPEKESDLKEVIFEPALQQQINELATSMAKTVQTDSYFSHALFYGPPGTGKTMAAMRIARSVGLDYMYFAASSLDQFSLEEALTNLTNLFKRAENSSKKLVIIIDEAEMLLASRSKELSEKSRKMLNLVLTYTGTETKNFALIALTNRPQDLDSAFLSRCDDQIEIKAPARSEQSKILDLYINKFLIEPSKKVICKDNTPLTIEEEVLSDSTKNYILDKIAGLDFVGRDISKLVLSMQHAAYASENCTLNKEMVNRIVALKIAQKTKDVNGFGKGYESDLSKKL